MLDLCLERVDRASAAAGSAAATDGGAATGADGGAGANVGPDFHVSFLSCLRLIAHYPACPLGRPNLFYGLVGVDGAAAATGRAAATGAAAATILRAAATIDARNRARANIGPDLHFSFLPRLRMLRVSRPASCPPKYLHQPPRGSPSARPTIRRAAEPPPAALHVSLDPFVEIAAGALTRTNVDPDLQMLPPRLRSQAPHPAAGSSSGISLGAKAIFLTPSLMVTLSTVTSIVTPRNFAISSMRNGTSILSSFESTLLSRPT